MLRKIVAVGENKVKIQLQEQSRSLAPASVRIKTLYSLISQGTECSTIQGKTARFRKQWSDEFRLFQNNFQSGKCFPVQLGYSCVGTITEIGSNVSLLNT